MTRDEVLASAERIRRCWQAGRCCRLVARGLRARVLGAARRLDAGSMDPEVAGRIAMEAENVAMAFGPLPAMPR